MGENYEMDKLMPATLSGKMKMAEILIKSRLLPQSVDTPAKAMVILQMGHELGLQPMMAFNGIYVVNNRPAFTEHLMGSLVRQHPEYAGMRVDSEEDSVTVTVKRKLQGGETEEFASTFSLDDARTAGLLDKDNWKRYPKRMLKARASNYAMRDAFPDVLGGMISVDEAQEYSEVRDVTPEGDPDPEMAVRIDPAIEPKRREVLDHLHELVNAGVVDIDGAREWESRINKAALLQPIARALAEITTIMDEIPNPITEEDEAQLSFSTEEGFKEE